MGEKRRMDTIDSSVTEVWADVFHGEDGKDKNFVKRTNKMNDKNQVFFSKIEKTNSVKSDTMKQQFDKMGEEDIVKFQKQKDTISPKKQKNFYEADLEMDEIKKNPAKQRENDIFDDTIDNYGVLVEVPTVLDADLKKEEEQNVEVETEEVEDAHVPPPIVEETAVDPEK